MQTKLLADLKASYGLTCHSATPVSGGWLNEKWKITTDGGEWLVKQFSLTRYRPDQLLLVEAALLRQMAVEKAGVPCPAILPYERGPLRRLDGDTVYMVMAFSPGWNEDPATITPAQMRSLGDGCGRLHAAFSRLPEADVRGYPLDDTKMLDALKGHYESSTAGCPPDAPAGYREAQDALPPLIAQYSPAFFAPLPKGISHEDFAADNLLFTQDGLSAIVDFDRNHYHYRWHDIGRAMLSFALRDGRLDPGLIRAFLEGYTRHQPLSLENIADALRLSWCVEIPWWIQPRYFTETRGKVVRFREELLWLTAHWHDIDAQVHAT